MDKVKEQFTFHASKSAFPGRHTVYSPTLDRLVERECRKRGHDYANTPVAYEFLILPDETHSIPRARREGADIRVTIYAD